MRMIYKHLFALVMLIVLVSPVMADENRHHSCANDATVKLGKMGVVNEEALQKHIDQIKEQMKNVRHARGSHLSQKVELKDHLKRMQEAMEELHNQMYAEGCQEAMHGASMDTRIEVMEKRMNMMEQMMEQLIEHLSEQTQ